MKIVLHIFGILLLFAAILLGPDIWEEIRGPKQQPQQITITPEQEMAILEATRKKPGLPAIMPPQPAPPEPVVPQPRGGSGIEGVRGGGGGDTIFVGGQSAGSSLVPGSFDGGSGNDTLATDGAGWARLDGTQLRSFEVFRFKNDQPNTLYIESMGLESADHGKVTVEGDAAIDAVWLDPDLAWGEPVTGGGYVIYEGKDNGGRVYAVSVSQGVKVEIRRQGQ